MRAQDEIPYVINGSIELVVYARSHTEAYDTAERILDGIGAHVDEQEGLRVDRAWTGVDEL
jgi:hypothetical protein